VRIAKKADTTIYAAMKVIDKNAPERETVCSIATATSKEEDKCEKVKHSIEREVVIMKLIQHPNVIQLYDVYEDSENMYVPLSSVISSYPPQSPSHTTPPPFTNASSLSLRSYEVEPG